MLDLVIFIYEFVTYPSMRWTIILSLVPVVVFFAFYFLFSNLLPMGVLKSVLINLL